MRKSSLVAFFLIVILLSPYAIISKVSAEISYSSLSGTVVNNNGEPVEGAIVTILNTSLSDTTDSVGEFTVSNIPIGTNNNGMFSVQVTAEGYGEWQLNNTILYANDTRFIWAELANENIYLSGLGASGQLYVPSGTPDEYIQNSKVQVFPPCHIVSSVSTLNAGRAHGGDKSGKAIDLGANNVSPTVNGVAITSQKCKDSLALASISGSIKTRVDGNGGKYIDTKGANGVMTRMLHQSGYISSIEAGTQTRVSAGERVGTIGQTGLATFDHIHYEVYKNGQMLKYSEWEFIDGVVPQVAIPSAYEMVHTDFNGDQTDDILWRAKSDAAIAYWKMISGSQVGVNLGASATDWKVVGIGDFDGDAIMDILWRSKDDTQIGYWKMYANGNYVGVVLGETSVQWKVAGIGDLNGDKIDDILWRAKDDTQMSYWKMSPSGQFSINFGDTATDWKVIGLGDFDGNGIEDILWRAKDDTQIGYWKMLVGGGFESINLGATASTWKVIGIGDLNGDKIDDILWRAKDDTQMTYWKMSPSGQVSINLGNTDASWKVIGVGDYSGDKIDDILWRAKDDTQIGYWRMYANGAYVGVPLGATDSSWKVISPSELITE